MGTEPPSVPVSYTHLFDLPHQTPLIGGAASATLEPIADIIHEPVASAPALITRSSPAERAAALIASDSNKAAQSEEHDATQQVAQPSTCLLYTSRAA